MFRDNHGHRDPFHAVIHAMGHGWARRGAGGGFGGGRGGGFMGGDGFPPGRKLGSAELQLVLLALLAERPAHGYELIRTLEERSGGFYAPSPGMIYPSLTYLNELGHAEMVSEGNRKLYSITEAGRVHLDQNKAQAEMILDALTRIGGRMEDVREAFAGLGDIDPAAADELHNAKHMFKRAIMRMRGCTPDDARRVAKIMRAAAEEILNLKK
jgi:DNA-binding PadR family transcriptional regulator